MAAGWMVVAMVLWAVIEMLPALLSSRYHPFEIVWFRYSTHLALMLAWWLPRQPARLVRARRPGLHALRGLASLGMPLFFLLGAMRLPVHTVMALFWAEALLTVLLASLWLGERVRPWLWAAVAVAYGGTLLLARPVGVPGLAAVFPLAMAACFAVYQIATRKMLEETVTARLFYTALAVWSPLTLTLPWVWTTPTPADLGVLATIGVLGYVCLYGIDQAFDAVSASRAAPLGLAQPIATALLPWMLGRAAPTPAAVVGMVVVILASLLVVWLPDRKAGERDG